MLWLKWAAWGLAAALLVLITVLAYGRWLWQRSTDDLVVRLNGGRQPTSSTPIDASEWGTLPAPVQRYFRAALPRNGRRVVAVDLSHAGHFNMSETAEDWRPFTSTQRVVTQPPGFVWDGRIGVLPGLSVHVHDAYVKGEGILHPTFAGLFSLMDLRGRGDIAEGEMLRYLAETAWYPTALLPMQGVTWEPLDDRSARATLQDAGLTQSLTFVFGSDDMVQSVRAQARGRTVAGRVIPTPWEGRWSRYEERNGMQVPTEGEVAWLPPEGRRPYWRGTLTAVHYEFAQP